MMMIGLVAGLILLGTFFQASAQSPSARQAHGAAAGKFLVASRSLRGPNFAKTVVLLTDHSDEGTMGLIINRPTDIRLVEVLPATEGLEDRPDTVYIGGPVARRGMMLLIRTDEAPENARRVLDGLYLSASRTVLETMILEADSDSFRVYSGHSGWGPGQLENEMKQGAWHIFPADIRTVFDPSLSEVWQRLIDRTQMRFARADYPDR